MSLDAFTTRPTFNRPAPTLLELRGLRFFAPEPEPGQGGAGGADDKDKGAGGNNDDKGSKLPTTQAELDALIGREKGRVKAQYADYDELKAKAAKVDAGADDRSADQKAIDDAKEAGRREGLALLASERVDNALKSALSGRAIDPNVLVMGFDKSQFIKGDGADTDAIKEWVEKHSSEVKQNGSGRDPGQGGRDASANGGSVQAGRDLFDSNHKSSNRKE